MNVQSYLNKLNSGEVTAQSFTRNYLIKMKNNNNLNAIIEINDNALKEAFNMQNKAILRGYPILVKDNINTCDNTATSAGSLSLANNIVKEDAPIIQSLRNFGATILGKSNMTEFANYMVDYTVFQGMPNGYSSRGGQCIHPLNTNKTNSSNINNKGIHGNFDPSGSSTGSAIAVATGLAHIAIGSETYGSIISPSQRLGIVGIKPTVGSISTEGVIPISATLDTLGPMATCVDDIAIVLGILHKKNYYTNLFNKPRIGVYKSYINSENYEIIQANVALLNKLESEGATVINLNEESDYINETCVFYIMRYEFKKSINNYLQKYANESVPKSLSDIIKFNNENKDKCLRYGQNNLIAANEISDDWQTQGNYVKAINERNYAIQKLESYFNENNLDIVFMASAHCGLAAVTGFPSITVPIYKNKFGLPIGCCLVAQRNKEDVLVKVAKLVENIVGCQQ